jgi:hypothetical protein
MADAERLREPHAAETARSVTVTAIIAAYNEADIIAHTVGALVSQGIRVYLIDTGSTDATVTEARRFLGHGLLYIEELPLAEFSWRRLMKRKEALACELDSDWFIHADADEFRESPWTGLTLLDGIRLVDALGYNAIDFAVLDFVPTHDDLAPGDDPREAFPYFEPGGSYNKLQIRCWKKPDGPVDLASSAGHEAVFSGRKVFPIRFILRHYPFRGQAHAQRKLFQERRPRYPEDEKRIGWHIQYKGIPEGHRFIRGIEGLKRFDPVQTGIDLQVQNRIVEDLERNAQAQILALNAALEDRGRAIAGFEHRLARTVSELTEVTAALSSKERQLNEIRHHLDEVTAALARKERQLLDVYNSVSWQVTLPFRLVLGWILSFKK